VTGIAEGFSLHELKPAEGSHRTRKRVGRGPGSGTGKTAGRGQKGQKSRAGSHRMRAGFEGGQMPQYMRMGKLRGPNHKKSMPMGPFRTHTIPVNVGDLERFDAGVEVTPELLEAAGVVRHRRHPIKVLAGGTLTRGLTVHAHAFSRKAVEAIESAGGKAVVLPGRSEPEPAAARRAKPKAAAAVEAPAVDDPVAEPAQDAAGSEPAAEHEPAEVAEQPEVDAEPADGEE
jgi:large subunit ribosomal protein L15